MSSDPRAFPSQSTVHLQIARTYAACISAFEQYTDIHIVRWRVLFMLYNRGESTQKELAEHTGLDGWSITRAVKPMEEEGFIERELVRSDNRLTLVKLTAAGRALYKRLEKRREAFLRHALHGMGPDEVELMERLLARVESNLADPELAAAFKPDPAA